MHFDNAFGDGKPESGASLCFGDRIISLLKLLEQLGLICCGNAGSGVADRKAKGPVCCSSFYDNLPRVGKFDSCSPPQAVGPYPGFRQTGAHSQWR